MSEEQKPEQSQEAPKETPQNAPGDTEKQGNDTQDGPSSVVALLTYDALKTLQRPELVTLCEQRGINPGRFSKDTLIESLVAYEEHAAQLREKEEREGKPKPVVIEQLPPPIDADWDEKKKSVKINRKEFILACAALHLQKHVETYTHTATPVSDHEVVLSRPTDQGGHFRYTIRLPEEINIKAEVLE